MRGDPSLTDHVGPDHTVAVLGYGRLREPTAELSGIEGVSNVKTAPNTAGKMAHTDGSVGLRRRSAADGGTVTPPVDGAVEQAPVVIVSTDLEHAGGEPAAALDRVSESESTGIAVVAFPVEGEPAGESPRESLDRLRSAADVTVAHRGEHREEALEGMVTAVIDIMAIPGFVNLDLADIRTVLASGPYAAIATGTAKSDANGSAAAVTAVEAALDSISIPITSVASNLVYLVGGPEITLEAGMAAIEALTDGTADSPSIIWGAAVDDDRESVTAHVVSGIDDDAWLDAELDAAASLTPGEPCPRCGGSVVAYSFGDNETQACDDCGYTGIAARG